MNLRYEDAPQKVAVEYADLLSAISLIRGISLPLDMNPWRDGILNRLNAALEGIENA